MKTTGEQKPLHVQSLGKTDKEIVEDEIFCVNCKDNKEKKLLRVFGNSIAYQIRQSVLSKVSSQESSQQTAKEIRKETLEQIMAKILDGSFTWFDGVEDVFSASKFREWLEKEIKKNLILAR